MTDDVLSQDIIQILEKNVNVLKSEGHSPDVALDFRDKLELFGKLSYNLIDKLQSLLHLSENYTSMTDFRQFVRGIIGSWNSINKQICKKCSKIQMGSRTLSGIPLSLVLEKIKREQALTRELLRSVCDAKYSREYLTKCYALLSEIDDLIHNLERSDDKLQQYLAILKINPFLIKLESAVDAYISNIDMSPIDKSKCPKLDVFPIVVKLLTGELLDHEPMEPCRVLAENAPRKPVFIIKIKRRTDVPPMTIIETM